MVSVLRPTPLRAVVAGGLAIAMLLPGSLSVASAQTRSTGTLVGSVTCGPDAVTPAANVVVAAEGVGLQSRTSTGGHFVLSNVPATQGLTIDVTDAQGVAKTSRYNVVVQPGEMLDIGSMDLAVCPQVGLPAPSQDFSDQEERGPAPY
jgi:hypothetical protein